MFGDPMWQQLHVKIARYIAPYDAVAHRDSLANAGTWIRAAEARHAQILVSFYHSEHTPTRLPSVSSYQRDVQKFVKLFPHVRQYQSWDEANRGQVPHAFSSPSAVAAAQYYQALQLLLLPLRDVLSLALWSWSFATRRVHWRNEHYHVNRDGSVLPVLRL